MSTVAIDVAVELPPVLADRAAALNQAFAQRLAERSSRAAFAFGDGCIPHVSLFMLAVEEAEVRSVLAALAPVADRCPPIPAEGMAYRHNPFGAPELYFIRTPTWHRLQEAVIAAVEPLRRDRLRTTDPTGAILTEVVGELTRDEPDNAQLRQLRRYGYDEVTDADDDRFNPHVTLAWPVEGQVGGTLNGLRVDWDGLSTATEFSGTLTELGVFRMGGYGTCVHRYGNHRLHGAEVSDERRV